MSCVCVQVKVWVWSSVTRFWQNFTTLAKKMKKNWQFFEGLISFWRGNVEPTFTIFLLLENFQRDKWPNIKK